MAAPAAQAVTFNFRTDNTTPQAVIDGFNEAGALWSSLLANDITLDIDIAFATTLGNTVLGTTSATEKTYQYQDVYGALLSGVTSADDQLATSSLPTGTDFDLLINYTRDHGGLGGADPNTFDYSVPYLDNDGGLNNQTIRMTHANAKALGLFGTPSSSSADATITLNSQFNWDFDGTDGISAGAFDFVGVAAHEIGHALGFISGVDYLDENSPFTTANGSKFFFPENTFSYVSPLDLFRFSSDSLAAGPGVMDWTAGSTDKYFSIDGGVTPIARFATGVVQGDGYSAGHWANGVTGIMNPTIASGEQLQISTLDLQAFDVIGWTLTGTDPSRDTPSNPASDAGTADTETGGAATIGGDTSPNQEDGSLALNPDPDPAPAGPQPQEGGGTTIQPAPVPAAGAGTGIDPTPVAPQPQGGGGTAIQPGPVPATGSGTSIGPAPLAPQPQGGGGTAIQPGPVPVTGSGTGTGSAPAGPRPEGSGTLVDPQSQTGDNTTIQPAPAAGTGPSTGVDLGPTSPQPQGGGGTAIQPAGGTSPKSTAGPVAAEGTGSIQTIALDAPARNIVAASQSESTEPVPEPSSLLGLLLAGALGGRFLKQRKAAESEAQS